MRLVGYVRVSRVAGREGDSFISPSLQREQVSALAKARGHEIVEWIEDLDESGGKWERPGFQRALAMVEQGQADGIGVAKLDRFARSLADALRAIERLTQAGGELISVADNFDTTTAMGRAMLQISLVFAELERERQREGFRAAKVRAIERGIHISTHVPVGYRRGHDRRLLVDAKPARAIRQVFLRRAQGDSWGELAAFLDSRLPKKGAWTRTTVAKLIRNRAYLGEAHQGEIVNAHAHTPLVSRAEWEAAQPAAGTSNQTRGSLLSGLLRCASCDGPLTRASSVDYGCRARRATGLCPAPVSIRISIADDYIENVFLEWASQQGVRLEAVPRDDNIDVAVEQLEAAEAELAAYRDANLVSVIGRTAYTAGLRERAERIEDAQRGLSEAQAKNVVPFPHLDAPGLWPTLTLRERRMLIDDAIEKVVVSGGTSVPSERLMVVFRHAEDEIRLAGTQDGE